MADKPASPYDWHSARLWSCPRCSTTVLDARAGAAVPGMRAPGGRVTAPPRRPPKNGRRGRWRYNVKRPAGRLRDLKRRLEARIDVGRWNRPQSLQLDDVIRRLEACR
jgi:hypothetical protein